MSEEFKCPRRDPAFDAVSKLPQFDTWDDREGARCCSYCGSLHPDDFIARIEAGEQVAPTDKNYKAYIGDRGRHKFYFMHLSDEQRSKFIQLYNDKTMKIGIPGYFYVDPYFCQPAPKEGA